MDRFNTHVVSAILNIGQVGDISLKGPVSGFVGVILLLTLESRTLRHFDQLVLTECFSPKHSMSEKTANL